MPAIGPSSDSPVFRLDACAIAILARSVPGLASVCLSWSAHPALAAGMLLLAVWSDVVVGWIARRRRWAKLPMHVQIEGFVDFTSFIWAPVQVLIGQHGGVELWIAGPIFVLAGLFRLARFNVEGLVNGGYRGLPVTYNGYLVPLTALGAHYLEPAPASMLCAGVLLVLSALMISKRLKIPEF
jgi:phosphatidylserine synthase